METTPVAPPDLPSEHASINNPVAIQEPLTIDDSAESLIVKKHDEGRLSRCKCAIVQCIFLLAVVFMAYSITRLINSNPNSTHKFYGPQFQTGWHHTYLTLYDMLSVNTIPARSQDTGIGEFSEKVLFISPLSTWATSVAPVTLSVVTTSLVNMSSQYCPVELPTVAKTGLKLGGISITIGSDGLPVISGQMLPSGVFIFKCTDQKCSSVKPMKLINNAAADVVLPPSVILDTNDNHVNNTKNSGFHAHTLGNHNILRENIPFYGQTRIIITRSGLPLVVSGTSLGQMTLYKCLSAACDNVSMLRVVKNVDSSSLAMILGPNGFPIISYVDLNRYPVVLACLDDNCLHFTRSNLIGIEVPSNTRVALHVTINGVLLVIVPGKWSGATATETSFVHKFITETQSLQIFNILKTQPAIMNARGIVNTTMSMETDQSMLDATYSEDVKTIILRKLMFLRGASFSMPTKSVVIVQCGHLGCSTGSSRVIIPLSTVDNVTDISVSTSSAGAPLFFMLQRNSVELWGTSSSLSSFQCTDNNCLSNEKDTVSAVHTLIDGINSHTGQLVIKTHPYSTKPMLQFDHLAIPHVLRCVRSSCQQATVQTYSHLDLTCSAASCFDMTVSPIDGMPVLVMGTFPSVIHCANPYCSPYGS